MAPPLDFSNPSHNHTFPGGCKSTEKYTAEQICSIKQARWVNWYIADYVYARQTILFLCLGIFVLAVCRQWHIQTASKAHGSQKNFLLTPVKATKRVVALSRWMASRKLRIPHWSSMSLGQYLILSCFGLFLLLQTVIPQPYYWPELTWAHSPPLATRAGWMGLAPLPILLALASKRNPVAWLTGTSHETLQVFHRWTAHFMLIMGLIHTFAFVKYNAEAGISQARWKGSYQYWTGVAMLIPEVWLSIMSLSCFRNRAYEWFKLTHRIVSGIFVLFFFFHCGNILTSWRYFYGAVAIYGATVAYRVLQMLWIGYTKLRKARAYFTVEGPNLLVIRIKDVQNLKWRAGQHFFFRFTGSNYLDSWQSHPFTPVTLPNESTELVAVVKIRRGQTEYIASQALWFKEFSTGIWLDGPYGVPLTMAPAYDRFLLLGGGSGLSFALSAAQELVSMGKTNIHLVAVCRTEAQLRLYREHLAPRDQISVDLSAYTTGQLVQTDAEKESVDSDTEKLPTTQGEQILLKDVKRSRPDLKATIRAEVAACAHQRLAIIACGPASFMRDIEDEVARLQMELVKGQLPVEDIWFRSEAFQW